MSTPTERKNKLGHLEVISSPLVKKVCSNFEDQEYDPSSSNVTWEELPTTGDERKIIFCSSSAFKIIESTERPHKAIAFVKSALMRMDSYAISRLDRQSPSPFAIRDIMKDSALFHSTAFPLRYVRIPGKTIYHGIREIIFESVKDKGLKDSINGALMETLKWIAYEKWNSEEKKGLEPFGCPHCSEDVATLPFNQEKGECPGCGGGIFITDLFGLHLTMQEEYAPNQVSSDYLIIAETLMIFSPIRHFWENNKEHLDNSLMIKEGALSLRATLSKLKAPIQRFFAFAKANGHNVALVGYETSGAFYDHFKIIGEDAPDMSIFIPNDTYIKEEIQHSNTASSYVYGQDTNYGAKVFVKFDELHQVVLNIPTGLRFEGVDEPSINNLISLENIVATLPSILSNKNEGGFVPAELARDIASLSTYPSAKALELFSEFNLEQNA